MRKDEVIAILEPIAELIEAKGGDYQNNVPLEAYFPFSDKSYVHMLNTKVLRLISLASKSGVPNFEGARDSVYDLIAYGVFYIKHLDQQAAKLGKDRNV